MDIAKLAYFYILDYLMIFAKSMVEQSWQSPDLSWEKYVSSK